MDHDPQRIMLNSPRRQNMTHPEINLLWVSHVLKIFGR
jgi:hypothetical protein